MDQDNLFREAFSRGVVDAIAARLSAAWPEFAASRFTELVFPDYDELSYGARARRIVDGLAATLPHVFPDAVDILIRALGPEPDPESQIEGFDGFYVMPFTMYVARFGMEHLPESLNALYEMTKRFTAEGDIRPFIQRYPNETLAFLRRLREDPSPYARRLVSEGTRPRLPLSGRLPEFQADPRPVLDLIQPLVADPSEMVRRSVANNVNDISKDNPELAVDALARWREAFPGEQTERLIRHALRTLIKKNDPLALAMLGFETKGIDVTRWSVSDRDIHLGDTLSFSVDIVSTSAEQQRLAINYVVHFVKSRGQTRPKVFRLPDKTVEAGTTLTLRRSHVFRNYRNQSFYTGAHRIELTINGDVVAGSDFNLVVDQ